MDETGSHDKVKQTSAVRVEFRGLMTIVSDVLKSAKRADIKCDVKSLSEITQIPNNQT